MGTVNWNKVSAVAALGCLLFAALTFAIQVWPAPQLKGAPIVLFASGSKLIAVFIALGFVLSGIAIYRSWFGAKPKSRLIIHRAVYGAGPQADIDITNSLQNREREGLVIPVDNNLVDHDPAPNSRKRLELRYSFGDGSEHYVYRLESTGSERVRLIVPEDSELARLANELDAWKTNFGETARERDKFQQEYATAANKALTLEKTLANRPQLPLTVIQVDAIQLSSKILQFLEELGAPPEPKYTHEQIDNMPSDEMKKLINSKNGDFTEACEYWKAGDLSLVKEAYDSALIANWRRLLPWYEKLRARFALELKDQVENLRHRFAVEEIFDNALSLPVKGRDGLKNLHTIASKLWEMAYRVGDKEVPSEGA